MGLGGYIAGAIALVLAAVAGVAVFRLFGLRAKEREVLATQDRVEVERARVGVEAVEVERARVEVETKSETSEARVEILADVEPIRDDLSAQAEAIGAIIGAKERKP